MARINVVIIGGTLTVAAGLSQALGDATYAMDRVYPGERGFAFANLLALTWHVLIVAGLIALAIGSQDVLARLGVFGVGLGVVGMLLLISAEVVTQLMSAIPIPLIAASAPVTGIGLVLAGTALLRSGAAGRMRGLAAILVGGYAIAAMVPTSLGADGANYFVIAGWGVCWALLGASLMAAALRTDPTAAPVVTTNRLATAV